VFHDGGGLMASPTGAGRAGGRVSAPSRLRLPKAGAWLAAGRPAHSKAQDQAVCAGACLSAAHGQGTICNFLAAQSLLAVNSASLEVTEL